MPKGVKVIERNNDFGSKDLFVNHKNCGWFHNCYSCGDMINDSEDHYFQLRGIFNGHNQCETCWKGNK